MLQPQPVGQIHPMVPCHLAYGLPMGTTVPLLPSFWACRGPGVVSGEGQVPGSNYHVGDQEVAAPGPLAPIHVCGGGRGGTGSLGPRPGTNVWEVVAPGSQCTGVEGGNAGSQGPILVFTV